ncbi:MAG: phosphoribosyltransferase family protein [Methanobacteriota archaeon]
MAPAYQLEDRQAKTWEILKTTGAYMEGHFSLPGTGYHYDRFFQVPLAFQHSRFARHLAVMLSRVLRLSGVLNQVAPDRNFTIIAPEDAGIPVAFWMGEQLQADRIIWARKKSDKEFDLRPFIEVGKRDQVLIVDDTLLTGGTLRGVTNLVKKKGGDVIGIALIVDRRDQHGAFEGVPVFSLLQAPSKKYDPKKCPHCRKGEKLVEIPLYNA